MNIADLLNPVVGDDVRVGNVVNVFPFERRHLTCKERQEPGGFVSDRREQWR